MARPARPFKQIGIVSVVGGVISSDVAIYKKLRKAAADLGADAVVVPDKAGGFWKRNQGTAIRYELTFDRGMHSSGLLVAEDRG